MTLCCDEKFATPIDRNENDTEKTQPGEVAAAMPQAIMLESFKNPALQITAALTDAPKNAHGALPPENNADDLREQPPLALAFVGDGVLELLVRRRLVQRTRLQPGALHKRTVEMVSAKGQAAALKVLLPFLTQSEETVLRRGKNATKATVSKHASAEEYRASTGLECLLGYLYLSGQATRITELFEIYWAFFENRAN